MAAGGIPVPDIHAEGLWCGHPALLLTWYPARTFLDEVKARPWRIWQLGVAFGLMQAAIYAIAVPDDMAHDTEGWVKLGGPDDAMRKRLKPLSHGSPVNMHFDYHPLNVLTDGTRITCVLDWPNTLVGDRRADLARTFTMLACLSHRVYCGWGGVSCKLHGDGAMSKLPGLRAISEFFMRGPGQVWFMTLRQRSGKKACG